ncbi:MAG: hypothetical protein AAF901_01380 [Bacteroidota bacterium]
MKSYLSQIFNHKQASVLLVALMFVCGSLYSFAQVTSKVDTTKIKIGEQIKYEIRVEADTTDLVVFPQGQTFLPLEMVEALETDTTKKDSRYELLKTYMLTQFDSGTYNVPRQKIIIGDNTFFTDSLKVEVNTIEVDTTKQGLYDIKPIIEVDKPGSNWWKYLLITLLAIGLVAFLLYWFIWRKKPLTEEEEIALLPPYDRAKLAIQKLKDSKYLINSQVKEYYSELTDIIRKYLDEKVYNRAMESTTDELITRLQLLKDGNQFPFSKDTLSNLETLLKRADLVKFAKSTPDTALAEMDRTTIDKELDSVKATLPEPSEEEKLLDQQYKEAKERKKKRQKVIITVAASVFLLIATFVGFGLTYGFTYVKDTIVGNDSKQLLEGQWVKSAYGVPPIYISTPEVLKREEVEIPEEQKDKIINTTFRSLEEKVGLDIQVSTTVFNLPPEAAEKRNTQEGAAKEALMASEAYIKLLESQGAQNITVKREEFITPNAVEGLKTFGAMSLPMEGSEESQRANYAIFIFLAENTRMQVILQWRDDDTYLEEIITRVIESIELKTVDDNV